MGGQAGLGPTPLAGRQILLTGASRGIGAAVARELAAQGAALRLVARDEAALARLVAGLPGGPHRIAAFDVADEAAWERAAAELADDGGLAGVVTAAGVLGAVGPVGTFSAAGFRRTIEVNLVGTLLAVSTALGDLVRSGGSVVTFSGGGATGPFPRFDAYSASKAAVVRLSENLAMELKDDGVRVNCIAPGFVVSAMHDETLAAGPELAGADYFERTRHAVESGGGDSPRPAAELAAFLLSDDSSGITGKLISARWDPWREERFRERLRDDAHLATLRRIDDQLFTSIERER